MPVTPDWWSAVAPAAAAPGPPPSGAGGDVESIIREVAGRYQFAAPDLLVATARQESGLNPQAVGDQGQSYGIFQEHSRGRGAGIPVESRRDVAAATERAIREFNAIRARYPDADPGTWAAKAQRPLDPVGYARSVNALLGQSAARPAAAPAPPASGPEWWQAVPGARDLGFRYGRDEGPGVQPLPAAAPARPEGPDWWQPLREAGASGRAPAGTPGELVWPLAGQSPGTARITNPFGAPQVRSAGFTGSLPAQNYGVDVGARAGTPVVAPAAGVVKQVLTTGGQHYGYGNSVVLDLGGGREVQLSHFQDAPAVRVGQRVNPGDLLGHAGMSGNATGVHLDMAAREHGRPVDALTWFGAASASPRASDGGAPGRPSGRAGEAPAWWAAV